MRGRTDERKRGMRVEEKRKGRRGKNAHRFTRISMKGRKPSGPNALSFTTNSLSLHN